MNWFPVVFGFLVFYYNTLNGRISSLSSKIEQMKNVIGGLSYEGLEYRDGVTIFNVADYARDLMAHQAESVGWLGRNPALDEPALSSGDKFKFWSRRNYHNFRNWMLFVTGLAMVMWSLKLLWPVLAQMLVGTDYGYTGQVIPHHTPHLVWLAVMFVSFVFLALALTTLAVELNGHTNAAMNAYCEWETRRDKIAWHEEKLEAVRAELARLNLGIAGLRSLLEHSAG